MNEKKALHPALEAVIRRNEEQRRSAFRAAQSSDAEKAPVGVGFLTLVATDAATGEIKQIEHGDNIVVKLGRKALAHLLAGDSVDQHKVVAMRFGDGSGTPGVADTGLFGAAILLAGGATQRPVTVDFPDAAGDDMKVRFTAVVNADEGNGGGVQEYREAVLLKGDGNIFSHKVSGTITKDNTVVLTASWTYIF